MIRTKDVNIISDLLKFTKKHKHVRNYTIGSFLVKNKTIVSSGVNSYTKTHAKTPQTKNYIVPSHSEVCCLAKYLVKKKPITDDMTLYVVGLTKAAEGVPVTSSKPCEICQGFIHSVGIKRVVFVENDFVNEIQVKEMEL